MPKQSIIDLDCELIHETAKAWLLDFGTEEHIWIPKSVGDINENKTSITLPIRYATDKGLT